ncbi:MAG: GxxExxY protein [Flavobacteriia bacterium]|nr:GxxExxY protein [Flavobacteriia bacterium]
MLEHPNDPETFEVIGAAMAVHTELGPGFLESVYQEALAVELELRNIPYQREVELSIRYKGRPLKGKFRVDFICFGDVMVELKAQKAMGGPEESQLINYLKAGNKERGLLLNFGAPSLQQRRFVNG